MKRLRGVLLAVVCSIAPGLNDLMAAAPVIQFEPTPQTTILGGTARFTVIAGSDPAPTYRWRKDGIALFDDARLSGAATDVLEIRDVRSGDVGNYSVFVSNNPGDDTSIDATLSVNTPQGGDVDFAFDAGSNIDSTVHALATQPDGKVVIGGDFTSVHGAARGRIARLRADGATDHTFGNGLPGANGIVYTLAIQSDGRVLIGGSFTSVNGTSRSSIARLNADGSLDTTFGSGFSGADGIVYSLAVQPDGRIVIGGGFTTVNGTSRSSIARLNADGSLDTTFGNGLSGVDSFVYSLVLQPDGRVVIGGDFATVNGTTRTRIARLNADGSLDTTFGNGLPGADGTVYALALQPDGRVLIGGIFSTVNGTSRSRIARLNADGTLDATFLNGLSGVNNAVRSLALQPDGRVLIGGDFTTANGTSRRRIARLNADGSLDAAFLNNLNGVNNSIRCLAVQPDGRVLIGGDFTIVNGASRNSVARLNLGGSVDTFVNGLSGADGTVHSIVVQQDGHVLIGGGFTAVNGTTRNGIARLNADGSLDTSFLNGLSGVNNAVRSLAVQPDGHVLIGGGFTSVNATSRGGIARLNPDGSLDTTFGNGLSGVDGYVLSLAVQPDGRVLIGGEFTTVNGTSRSHIARLNADGSLDTKFGNGLSGTDGTVYSLALQPDGRVLIGGGFTTVNGTIRNYIARLNADGSLDTTFLNGLSAANSFVYSLALQPDGRVLMGGEFTTINGASRRRIGRVNADGSLDTTFGNGLSAANSSVFSLALQTDGRVVIGGIFTTLNGTSRARIARLNADGSLDTTFGNNLSGANFSVLSLALQPDGRVLAGGDFTTVNEVAGNYVARLYGTSPVAPTITVDPSAQASYDGCCAVFTVTATGTPLDYRWRRNGVDLSDGAGISGARSATLRLTGVTAANNGNYSVVVSNVLGSDTSSDASLTVSAVPQCRVASCDPVLGCVLSTAPDGTACNDGLACSTVDACQAGVCTGGGFPTYYRDLDGDFYGDITSTTQACTKPAGYVYNALDCDDNDPTVRPMAPERCDGRRNDCTGAGWPAILDDDSDLTENACESCVDGDGDGYGDPGVPTNLCAVDNCPLVSNSNQFDADFDGRGNACDSCPLDPMNDEDGDGVCGDVDNCPTLVNAGEANVDGDRFGDTCDFCPTVVSFQNSDLDGDGIGNVCDSDVDGDGLGNSADPNDDDDPIPDDDGDFVSDPCGNFVTTSCDDNCPFDVNPSQQDRDGDHIGDSCDTSDGLVGGGLVSTSGSGSSRIYRFAWEAEEDAHAYNVYSGTLTVLEAGSYGSCFKRGLITTYATLDDVVAPGAGHFYLVTAMFVDHEGTLGDRGDHSARPMPPACP